MSELLVFTDLDGTLLDHHDYSYAAALPALQRLASEGYPLIINSSKTAAEIRQLQEELNNNHPFIVENGSAVHIPTDYFNAGISPGSRNSAGDNVHTFGPDYRELITQLHELRAGAGYRFSGFHDLGDEEVARLTGLGTADAALARKRSAAEPIIWQDTSEALEKFRADLNTLKLSLTKGGRFYHVMGQTDKAQAMAWLANQYRLTWPSRQWTTVALGDGPNDQDMLEVADIAVCIPPAEGKTLQLSRSENVIIPDLPGPRGWQNAIDNILSTLTDKGD